MHYDRFFIAAVVMVFMCSVGSAQLVQIESTTSGIMIPKMTETQRDNISSPSEGELIYQNDGTKGFYFWTGSAWQIIGSGGGEASGSSALLLHAGTKIGRNDQKDFSGIVHTDKADSLLTEFKITRSGKLKRFMLVFSEAVPSDGADITVTILVNGVDSALSKTMVNSDGRFYSDTSTEVNVTAGDVLNVRFQSGENGDYPADEIFITATFELEG